MNVSVYLKDGRVFNYGETTVLDDKEAGWFVLSYGELSGGRTNKPRYLYKDTSHIAYAKSDVDHIEIYPENGDMR